MCLDRSSVKTGWTPLWFALGTACAVNTLLPTPVSPALVFCFVGFLCNQASRARRRRRLFVLLLRLSQLAGL